MAVKDNVNKKKKQQTSKTHNVALIIGILTLIIVLGVITVLNFYQKKFLVSELKVNSETLEQGFKKALADEGINSVTETKMWQKCKNETVYSTKDACMAELEKYYKGVKFVALPDISKKRTFYSNSECFRTVGKENMWYYINDKSACSGMQNLTFAFQNGVKIDFAAFSKNLTNIAGQIVMDVNGNGSPNTWGRDAFVFNILNDGSLIPYNGQKDCENYAAFMKQDIQEILDKYYWKNADICSGTTKEDGRSCGARVIENSWKMDY